MKEMKLNFVLRFLILLGAFPFTSSAQDGCALLLSINENLTGETLTFSVEDVEVVQMSRQIEPLEANGDSDFPYKLVTRNDTLSILKQYPLQSSRLIIQEGLGGTDFGTIELENGMLDIAVPYDPDIRHVEIIEGENTHVLSFNFSSLTCSDTCITEDNTVTNPEQCCEGLFASTLNVNSDFICTKCGDGTCSAHEDSSNCAFDCPLEILSCEGAFVAQPWGCEPVEDASKPFDVILDGRRNFLENELIELSVETQGGLPPFEYEFRKSTDGGKTWSTVQAISSSDTFSSTAILAEAGTQFKAMVTSTGNVITESNTIGINVSTFEALIGASADSSTQNEAQTSEGESKTKRFVTQLTGGGCAISSSTSPSDWIIFGLFIFSGILFSLRRRKS